MDLTKLKLKYSAGPENNPGLPFYSVFTVSGG